MRKAIIIILSIFISLFFTKTFALNEGVYYHSNGDTVEIIGNNVKIKDSSSVLLAEYDLILDERLNGTSLFLGETFQNSSGVMYTNSEDKIIYLDSNRAWQLFSGLTFYNIVEFDVSEIGARLKYNICTQVNGSGERTCAGLYENGAIDFFGTLLTPLAEFSFNNQIVYKGEFLSDTIGSCTIETVPNYQNINIQPISSGAITEYIEDPIDLIYAYSTSLSGDQPLTVVASGFKNQTGFSDFSIQSGNLKFNTKRNELFFGYFFEDQTTLSISAKNGLQYIKLLGDYGVVDIIAYREDNQTVEYRRNGVNLNSFNTGFGYPIGGNYLVTILFKNGFFKKTLDTLEIYSIGANNTTTIEICYSEDTNTYTVDGELYYEGGNPYVDLVGEAVEQNVNFYDDGYTFFENGFCLRNFTAFPVGGELYFQIQKPNGELVSTYSLFPSGLQRYGNNTCTPITTNYHTLPGKYYVKGLYKNKGVVYEVNENFTTYQINSPEFIGSEQNPWADSVEACGVNENSNGFLPGVSRFFACLTQTISDFFKNQYQSVKGIGDLILKMTNIFSTEVKDFSFIETSYASPPLSESLNFSEPVGFSDTIFGKIKTLLWGVIATMVIIVSIGVFIYVKSND